MDKKMISVIIRKRNIFKRFLNYYRKNGFSRTLHRIYQHPYRAIDRNHEFLFYADMHELSNAISVLPFDIKIEPKCSYDDAMRPEMQRMINYWNEENLLDVVSKRFNKGAILWIIKSEDIISGFVWSIQGKMVSSYYIPLTPHDAALFDSVIFEEFRGRGLYPLLMNYVFWQLKVAGVHRTFGTSHAWNKASIQGIEKTYFRLFSQARKFNLLNRTFVIFSEVQK